MEPAAAAASPDAEPLWSAPLWRAGLVVFSARIDTGAEAVLWLVPRFDPGDSACTAAPTVRYARPPGPVDDISLRAAWWLFDSICTHRSCTCGEMTLAALAPTLSPACAAAAVAAHVDLLDAVISRFALVQALDPAHRHAAELAAVIGDLAAEVAAFAACAAPVPLLPGR
jgi:hypothetical protein